METGAIPVGEFPGGFDLQATVESGQTYLWERADGEAYGGNDCYGGEAWYHTVIDGEVIRVRQTDGCLEWESTTDAVPYLTRLFRLEDDLDEIMEVTPADALVDAAYTAYAGMRLVQDPFFPCLVTFICSAQMRVRRIFRMQRALAQEYGDAVAVNGETYYAYPTPERLATAPEAELRDLKIGYRAPYVKQTAQLVASGELTVNDIPTEYEAARDALTEYVGVGEKVADCVCLFSLGHLEAVPLDTWIRRAIHDYYPDCDKETYSATSRAIREQFGSFAGYAQTYVFHYLRHNDSVD